MQKGKPDSTGLGKDSDGRERVSLSLRLQQIEKAGVQHAQSFLVRRWANLKQVRRSALTWVVVAALLIGVGWWQTTAQWPLYSHTGPTEGGVYIEGTTGNVNTLNPIFATNVAERSLSQLLFAGLLRVDRQGDIAGDLAETWSVEDNGSVYTLTLRPGLEWSDGEPITSQDVLFTIDAIQSPASRSPLLSAWRNVKVEAPDERTVTFTLEAPYAPFLKTLTVGILPEHILANVGPELLRSAAFNSQPKVTSGPFSYRGTVKGRGGTQAQTDIYLTRNSGYHLGATKLERFTMRVYEDRESLVEAMQSREIMAANDVPSNSIDYFASQDELKVTKSQLFSGVFAFFKTTAPPLDDKQVRQALALGTDLGELTGEVGRVEPMQGPLLPGQLGFKEQLSQATGNSERAGELLDKAGWKLGDDGIRRNKKGQPLQLQVVTLNSGEFGTVAQLLQEQWQDIGVEVEVSLVEPGEFQQNVLTPHAYDVLVYQLALGRDSDSYAFWHSSQAQPGQLNLSEYRSDRADRALESGRSLVNPSLRDIKYTNFIEEWLKDVPAVALYRPNLYYIQLDESRSVTEGELGEAQERFANIQYWTAEMTRLYDTR